MVLKSGLEAKMLVSVLVSLTHTRPIAALEQPNSLPAAVVFSPSVTVFKRNLAKLTFSSFLTLFLTICVYVCLCILCCAFYCDVSGRLVLLFLIN